MTSSDLDKAKAGFESFISTQPAPIQQAVVSSQTPTVKTTTGTSSSTSTSSTKPASSTELEKAITGFESFISTQPAPIQQFVTTSKSTTAAAPQPVMGPVYVPSSTSKEPITAGEYISIVKSFGTGDVKAGQDIAGNVVTYRELSGVPQGLRSRILGSTTKDPKVKSTEYLIKYGYKPYDPDYDIARHDIKVKYEEGTKNLSDVIAFRKAFPGYEKDYFAFVKEYEEQRGYILSADVEKFKTDEGIIYTKSEALDIIDKIYKENTESYKMAKKDFGGLTNITMAKFRLGLVGLKESELTLTKYEKAGYSLDISEKGFSFAPPKASEVTKYWYGDKAAERLTGVSMMELGIPSMASGLASWVTGDKKYSESELERLSEKSLKLTRSLDERRVDFAKRFWTSTDVIESVYIPVATFGLGYVFKGLQTSAQVGKYAWIGSQTGKALISGGKTIGYAMMGVGVATTGLSLGVTAAKSPEALPSAIGKSIFQWGSAMGGFAAGSSFYTMTHPAVAPKVVFGADGKIKQDVVSFQDYTVQQVKEGSLLKYGVTDKTGRIVGYDYIKAPKNMFQIDAKGVLKSYPKGGTVPSSSADITLKGYGLQTGNKITMSKGIMSVTQDVSTSIFTDKTFQYFVDIKGGSVSLIGDKVTSFSLDTAAGRLHGFQTPLSKEIGLTQSWSNVFKGKKWYSTTDFNIHDIKGIKVIERTTIGELLKSNISTYEHTGLYTASKYSGYYREFGTIAMPDTKAGSYALFKGSDISVPFKSIVRRFSVGDISGISNISSKMGAASSPSVVTGGQVSGGGLLKSFVKTGSSVSSGMSSKISSASTFKVPSMGGVMPGVAQMNIGIGQSVISQSMSIPKLIGGSAVVFNAPAIKTVSSQVKSLRVGELQSYKVPSMSDFRTTGMTAMRVESLTSLKTPSVTSMRVSGMVGVKPETITSMRTGSLTALKTGSMTALKTSSLTAMKQVTSIKPLVFKGLGSFGGFTTIPKPPFIPLLPGGGGGGRGSSSWKKMLKGMGYRYREFKIPKLSEIGKGVKFF